MSDNIQFEDAESYSPNMLKDRLTFRDILLSHLKKITGFASVEFIGGYWEQKPHPNPSSNATINVYVPDTREVYSNAVECLADLLAPYFDKEMKENESHYEEAKKDSFLALAKNSNNGRGYVFADVEDRVAFRDIKRQAAQKLFRALCSFLYRKKYLELGSIED